MDDATLAAAIGSPDRLLRLLDRLEVGDVVQLVIDGRLAFEVIPGGRPGDRAYAHREAVRTAVVAHGERVAAERALAVLEPDVAIVPFVKGVDDPEAAVELLSDEMTVDVDDESNEHEQLVLREHAIDDGYVYVRGVSNDELTAALLSTRTS